MQFRAAPKAFDPILIFFLNVWICLRLFRTEYLDQLPSFEGTFIALAGYIRDHWPVYDWFPMWRAGEPFANVYQPLVHYMVAVLAAASGASPAHAYHVIAGLSYAFGGVAFYFLAKQLGEGRLWALLGAVLFSSFSPSLLLLPLERNDAGGLWNARRLQAVVQYADLPNVTGLAIAMLAISLILRAIHRQTPGSTVVAAIAVAAVPATNWPASIALALAVGSLMLALDRETTPRGIAKIIQVAGLAACFVVPFALPSSVLTTFHNATTTMSDGPSSGAGRWTSVVLLGIVVLVARFMLKRFHISLPARFALIFFLVTGWVVLAASWFGVAILTQPRRFHIAMEIPMVLLLTAFARSLSKLSGIPDRTTVAAAILLLSLQISHYREYARHIIRPVEITKSIEYQEARWFEDHIGPNAGRVVVPGSIAFWMNAFTRTPQLMGCCDQSIVNFQDAIAAYVIPAGYKNDAESADYSLLWMKAFAIQAFAVGGPASREAYKAFSFPYRFRGLLTLAWQRGDDYIYEVPSRAGGLARVIRTKDLVRQQPTNGIDVDQLRSFVAALDDSKLPLVSSREVSANRLVIHGALSADQIISVAVNYHPGWTAAVGPKSVPVRSDGLGLIVIEPGCSGPCEMELKWSPGAEPLLAACGAGTAVLFSGVWILLRHRRRSFSYYSARPIP